MSRRVSKVGVRIAAAALIGLAPAVAAGQVASAAGPGVRLVYGPDANGSDELVMPAPEYPTSRYSGPPVQVTIVNTGDAPLHVDHVKISGEEHPVDEGCLGSAELAVGATLSCRWYVSAPVGAPGTSATTTSTVSASSSAGTVQDSSPIRWDFYNVTPLRNFTVTPSATSVAAPGTPVEFTVQMYPTTIFAPDGKLVSLRSEAFGELFGSPSSAVTANSCTPSAQPPTCTFTARIPGRAGQTFTDTLRLEVSDGTGENGVQTQQVSVAIAPAAAKPSVRLAFGEAPDGPNSATVSVPADRSAVPIVTLTVVNTGDTALAVDTLRVAGTVFRADACEGSLTIPVGGHVTCDAAVDAPAGEAGTTAYFRAYVHGTGAGRGVEGEAHGRWSFTAPAPRARDAGQWAAQQSWPQVAVGRQVVGRDSSTRAVFRPHRPCDTRRALPATLGALVGAEAPKSGRCAAQWRLTRAATAAMLNEATLEDAFPADDVQSVVKQTRQALARHRPADLRRLAARYEAWNRGEARA